MAASIGSHISSPEETGLTPLHQSKPSPTERYERRRRPERWQRAVPRGGQAGRSPQSGGMRARTGRPGCTEDRLGKREKERQSEEHRSLGLEDLLIFFRQPPADKTPGKSRPSTQANQNNSREPATTAAKVRKRKAMFQREHRPWQWQYCWGSEPVRQREIGAGKNTGGSMAQSRQCRPAGIPERTPPGKSRWSIGTIHLRQSEAPLRSGREYAVWISVKTPLYR